MAVRCWFCDVRPLSDEALFARGMRELPWAERREKVLRYRFEKDRILSLGAGLLLAGMLQEYGVRDLTVHALPEGKLVLTNCPQVHFSLSHSGTLAVAAVSDLPVGVDTEILSDVDSRILSYAFQTSEQEWVRKSDDPGRAFVRLWTRKESYLKRLGIGFSVPPDSFSVLPDEPMPDGSTFSEWEERGHLICLSTEQAEKVELREYSLFSTKTE